MKLVVLIISLFVLMPIADTEKSVNWHTDLDKAKKIAGSEKKNILVYFTGSDWCGPCIQLKKDLFETSEFKELSSEYVLVYIDIPRNKDLVSKNQMEHNKAVFSKLNRKGVFPLFVALDKKGNVLDEYSGYSMNGEIGYHLDFLKRNQ